MENLLKQKDNTEQFLVIKNDQKHVPSPNWSPFGFPAKHVEDGSYQRIISFANCFKRLTVHFITSDYELYTFNLCCCRCNGVDKAGEAVSQPIQQQLNLFGLLPYMDNYKITFTSDRGSNILKALKDSNSSEDDTTTLSSSKYVAANTLLSDLLSKSEEVLNTITTSKKLFKYAGLNKNVEEHGDIALKQECVVRWLSMSNIL
ncbi:unnamed protein product [Rotaria sordida]|uniref:Uncharacterized protein n=1 Tax=Rotaria sordida TaxID=392033 RepID=A0A820E1L7_9BILA|nr:unnamed protein product [Rotaria sordida]